MLCPHCGCDAVIEDKIGSHEQSICAECGVIVSDQTFEDNFTDCYFDAPPTGSIPAGVGVNYKAFIRESEKKAGGNKTFYSPIGLDEVEITCDALRVRSSLKDEAIALYRKACEEPALNVRFKSKIFKENLGACCVYITLRKHEYPITAREMVSLRKLQVNYFIVMLRRLKKFMELDFPMWSIGELTVHTLKKCHFDREMIERTQKIMQICDKCWLITGRSPEEIIIVAAYFAWQSFQEPGLDEKHLHFNRFCKTNNLRIPKTSGIPIRMKTILTEMAKCIPWVREFKPKKFRYYIADIVKYKSILMRKAFAKPVTTSEGADQDNDVYYPPPCKKQCVPVEVKSESKTADEIDAEITAQYGHRLDSTELHPSEFEDEMSQYIKTEREKQDAEFVRKLELPKTLKGTQDV